MLSIVADVGGTNARLALARDRQLIPSSISRYRNDDFSCFEDLVITYLREAGVAGVASMAVAVAGPATGKTARLTNRDWRFDAEALSTLLSGAPAVLLNDLKALGLALAWLEPHELTAVTEGQARADGNGQSLVVGIGTGFNVSPVLRASGRSVCLDAEFGHVSLPASVHSVLAGLVGSKAGLFPTVEHCFSGRGLSNIHAASTATPPVPAEAVIAACRSGSQTASRQTLETYVRMLALLCRDLVLAFMPLSGLHLAGGVARAALSPDFRPVFAETFTRPFDLSAGLCEIPVSLIESDTAALVGCTQML